MIGHSGPHGLISIKKKDQHLRISNDQLEKLIWKAVVGVKKNMIAL